MNRADIFLERLPEPMTAAEYDSASTRIDALLRAIPGVVAVYKTGSVSAPGISDIDRIAVTDGINRSEGIWGKLTDREKYAAMHSPFIASNSTFAEHAWYANARPLELVSGEKINVSYPAGGSALISKILAIENLVILRLKLEKQAVTRRIKVRPLLCHLNNVRHCLDLAGLDERTAGDAWEVSRAVAEIRTTWWQCSDDTRITAVAEIFAAAATAIDSALEALRVPTACAGTGDLVLRTPWANVTLTTDDSYRRQWRTPRSLSRQSRRAAEILWRSTRRRLSVPAPILSTLLEVRRGSGMYADRRTRVIRYEDFLRSTGQGWSQLGVARVFAP